VLLRRKLLIGGGVLAAGRAADVFVVEPRWLQVNEVEWPVRDLPAKLDGYRIGHVTDLHLRSWGGFHDHLLAAVRQAGCNLVVTTGDLVESAAALPLLRDFLVQLARCAPHVIGVLGNWEHWSEGLSAVRDTYEKSGVELLINRHVMVDGLAVVGTDDAFAGDADPVAACANVPASAPKILLTHSPGLLDDAGLARFDAIFSGHTHGGQVRLLGWAPLLPPGSGSFVEGRYATAWGPLYVSRGLGASVVRGRFACRPELPIFRLKRA
jgi:predicted MPP superfamily phosphohydrolase